MQINSKRREKKRNETDKRKIEQNKGRPETYFDHLVQEQEDHRSIRIAIGHRQDYQSNCIRNIIAKKKKISGQTDESKPRYSTTRCA
jgi:hypothetical protein